MSDVIKNKWSWAIGLLLCVFCAWTGIEAQTPTTDLTTHAPTVTPPSGGVFHWYSSASPSIGTQVANPTSVLPGVYYGAYYFSTSNCYSAVTPLRVATNTCAVTTVNLNDYIDNAVTLPANTELRFHSASPVSDANRITGTAITAASAGTFFISYYNTAGACYTATAGVIVVVLTPCNQAPVITSNGGGATGTQNVAENSTAVTTVTATDPENSFGTPKFKISGGADAAKFSIDPATGVLSFVSAPDFENPTDVGANNVYDVQVTVTDAGGLTDVQDVAVTVTNVNESSDTDGDGLTDDIDLDDDNDGILDTVEDGQLSADSDGDGIPNRLDLDSDNDGLNDAIEAGGTDANNDGIADGTPNAQGIPASAGTGLIAPDTDGDTRTNPYDLDSDNDGINDVVETGNPALVDANGDGKVDGTDADGDGILGAADGTPSVRGDANDPNPANTDGTGGPNYVDLDSDGDGLTDLAESGIANPSTLDANGDGKIDNAADADGDGIPQVVDSAPATFGDANNSPLPDSNNNGTPDYADPLDTDGDGVADVTDLDDDNDGILDTVEDGQLSADSDGDGIPNRLDLDSDNDGLNDAIEAGGTDANNDGIADGTPNAQGIPASAGTGLTAPDTDGDTRTNPYDLDSDNDGINDLVESGNPALVDANGDGQVDGTDADGDGILGAADGTPSVRGDANDPNPANTDGTGGPNYIDLDSDGDGLTDLQESGIANPSTLDANGDGKIDNGADADGDGIPQVVDGAPATFGDANNSPLPDSNNNGTPDYVDPLDTDGDGVADVTDLDDDNDGILDTVEDGQLSADSDGDGIPNRLDLDSDNDGINDVIEAGGTDANNDGIADGTPNAQGIPASAGTGLTAPDTDGDTRTNPYDLDSDNDGINDVVETGNPALVDANGDGKVDGTDADGDGILGAADGTPSVRGDTSDPNPANTDGTGGPNYVDLDSDGDGLTDLAESGIANPSTLDANGDGKIDDPADADGDGIPQVVDGAPAVFGDANNPTLPDGNNNGTPDYVDTNNDGKLSIKVLLQGALFNSATAGIMRDDLRTGGHIPLNDPYSGSGNPRFAHAGSGAAATTTNTVLNANAGTNDAIVDWVFVELRSAANSATVVETRAALLQRDGDVVSPLDGVSPLSFANAAGISYYVGVKHRNHLGAMTASTQTLTMTGTTVDFTTMSDANVFNNAGYDGLEMVTVGSVKALWAGNVNADSKLKYQGTNSENTVVLSQVLNHPNNTPGLYNYNAGFGYYSGDINLDGKVKYQGTANDPGFLFFNVVTTYSLNSSALYNYDLLLEQLP